MRRRIHIAMLLALILPAAPAVARNEVTDWRLVAVERDRVKLRRWERSWREALAQAHAAPADAATIAADPALFDPFAAIDDPLPPAGAYRCRMIKLGGQGGTPPLAAGPWGMCRLTPDGPFTTLERLDGAQRPSGRFYVDAARRGVFLGTTSLGEERRPALYGHAAGRDLAGLVERIAPARWRVIVPYPPFEATLDLLELVPAT